MTQYTIVKVCIRVANVGINATAWADCVAYLEGRQCEKPAYRIGRK